MVSNGLVCKSWQIYGRCDKFWARLITIGLMAYLYMVQKMNTIFNKNLSVDKANQSPLIFVIWKLISL